MTFCVDIIQYIVLKQVLVVCLTGTYCTLHCRHLGLMLKNKYEISMYNMEDSLNSGL